MKCKHICNAGGYVFAAAGTVAFAYRLASVFYGTWWLTVILALAFGLMLHFGFRLFDTADVRDNIRTDKHTSDHDGAKGFIYLYADKYHNEDYHIQRALEYEDTRIEEERMVISLADEIRKTPLDLITTVNFDEIHRDRHRHEDRLCSLGR